ncbi:hypothetical protein AAC387_Pa03g1051 [Persea americana]
MAMGSGQLSGSQLKENWLDSLSCPFMEKGSHLGFDGDEADSAAASECVIGIDPDISGALAVLKGNGVFDTPHLLVLVGKRVRKHLDARSIVQLLRSFAVPHVLGIALKQPSFVFTLKGISNWMEQQIALVYWYALSCLLKLSFEEESKSYCSKLHSRLVIKYR